MIPPPHPQILSEIFQYKAGNEPYESVHSLQNDAKNADEKIRKLALEVPKMGNHRLTAKNWFRDGSAL